MATVLYNRGRSQAPKRDPLSEIADQLLGATDAFSKMYEQATAPIGQPIGEQRGDQLRLPGAEPSRPEAGKPEIRTPATEPIVTAKKGELFSVSLPKVDPHPAGSAFVEGMMRRGWTPEEAAGAAGNIHAESGFDPGIQERRPIAGRGGYGFLQWTGPRRVALENFARLTNRPLDDPELQMDWLHMERNGESVKYGGSDERAMFAKAFEGGGSPEDIAERFGQFVERPRRLSDTLATRRAAAAKYGYIDDLTDRIIGA